MFVLLPRSVVKSKVDRIVEEVERKFPNDVVRIRYTVGEDYDGDPAVFFRILLRDEVGQRDRIGPITGRIVSELFDGLAAEEIDYVPGFRFRTERENNQPSDEPW